jgi:hypothetical protein
MQLSVQKGHIPVEPPEQENVRLGTTMIAAIPYLLDERYDTRRTGS